MERNQTATGNARLERQIAHLKIISRLLGHELHNQTSPRLTLSREEVEEIRTSVDLFIEEVIRTQGKGHSVSAELSVHAVPARVN